MAGRSDGDTLSGYTPRKNEVLRHGIHAIQYDSTSEYELPGTRISLLKTAVEPWKQALWMVIISYMTCTVQLADEILSTRQHGWSKIPWVLGQSPGRLMILGLLVDIWPRWVDNKPFFCSSGTKIQSNQNRDTAKLHKLVPRSGDPTPSTEPDKRISVIWLIRGSINHHAENERPAIAWSECERERIIWWKR